MSDELLVDRHGSILTIRLNRPKARNALTPSMIHHIGAAARDAESDPEVRAVLITGTGDRAFCAGMDLQAFADGASFGGDDPDYLAYQKLSSGALTVPVVAAANGSAIGGGLELLLGCDVIVAADTATFGLPEVKRGLFPGGSGTAIAQRIPLGVALELTLTGDPITAARAYDLGLVNAVSSAEETFDTALVFAERIAANAPLGLAACKELVRMSVTAPTRTRERLSHWQSEVFSSEDAKEGARAFFEKRTPVWQGR
ncbi:enoyl-CoA hydratase-related protein [Nocardia fluminea]|uniref:enoyl-CoA hydratase-related protein n=1 Tax=Nocardia fluminea TaxID=134984 RepID=UPI003808DA22